MRIRSVGESVEVGFICKNELCQHVNPIQVHLDDVSRTNYNKAINSIQNEKIHFQDERITLRMQWPSFKKFVYESDALDKDKDEYDRVFDFMRLCIESVSVEDEEPTYLENEPKEEIARFLNSLNSAQIQKIRDFVDSVPRMTHNQKFTCTNCKTENETEVEGSANFFLLILSHESLIDYYRINFHLMQEYKYSMKDIENMLPWEREIYIELLKEWQEKKIQEAKNS